MTSQGQLQHTTSSASAPINPLPLSLPSFLVNPRPRARQLIKAGSGNHLVSPSYTPIGVKNVRQPGKRKLLRQENARFSNAINPHIVRPRPSDYSPGYEDSKRYRGRFQQPIHGLVKELGRSDEAPRDDREVRQWRRELDQVKRAAKVAGGPEARVRTIDSDGDGITVGSSSTTLGATSLHSGLFTMSLPEARFFLKRKAVVESRMDNPTRKSSASPTPSSYPSPTMQSLVDLVEDDFASWKAQVVYILDPQAGAEQADTTRLSSTPRMVVPSSSSLAQPRVEEHHHLPHSLSYLVPDSFDRLTVHCLARTWGLKSLSKTVCHNGEELKLTWILKPPPSIRRSQGRHRRPGVGAADGSRSHLNPLIRHLAQPALGPPISRTTRLSGRATTHGLDTPPATDISSQSEYEEGEATDADTIESASIASLPSSALDSDSDLGDLSDVGEVDEAGEETLRPLDPLDTSYDPLVVPVSRRLEELILITRAEDQQEGGEADDVESLTSSTGEREYEAEGEDDGEWLEVNDDDDSHFESRRQGMAACQGD